ncbi:MAG: GbsR/MarR family transcriptional regulator, partial [Chloroflexota bacterium]
VQFILNTMNQSEQAETRRLPSEEELRFVEEVALNFERQGLFRMGGRVLGWLLICDPPEQTFNQLAEVLQASKGSISNVMQLLVPAGIVQKVSRPGERRDYYRVAPNAWVDLARNHTRYYGEFKKLMEQGLRLLDDAPSARRDRLRDVHALYDFLAHEMPELWDRWERERENR